MDWSSVCLTTPFGPYAVPVELLSQDFPPEGGSNAPIRRRSHLRRYSVDVGERTPQGSHVSVIAEFTCGLLWR